MFGNANSHINLQSGVTVIEVLVVTAILGVVSLGLSQLAGVGCTASNKIDKMAVVDRAEWQVRYLLDCTNTMAPVLPTCRSPNQVTIRKKDNSAVFPSMPVGVSSILVTCGPTSQFDLKFFILLKGETDTLTMFKEVPFGC